MGIADRVSSINICNYYILNLLQPKPYPPNREEGKMPDKVLIFGKDA